MDCGEKRLMRPGPPVPSETKRMPAILSVLPEFTNEKITAFLVVLERTTANTVKG